ncbi:retrovirus-related pol polyprotein from transposon TNT 1-94 [Tanacetum coccineum]
MVNESLFAELERYKERVAIFEQRQNFDLNKHEKLIDSQMDDLIRNKNEKLEAFKQEIDTLKETLSNNVKEKESLSTTLIVFKTKSKEKESKYNDKEIILEKQNKELENIISQRIKPTLYDGSVIAKEHAVISVIDDEETLILEEDGRSKMLDKQNDPILIEKKINISLIDYSKLNKLKEDFGKLFVTKKEVDAEQAFWLKHSNHTSVTPVVSPTSIKVEGPRELPKVSLVNESLKKLKYQLPNFDKVVKHRTAYDAITAGAWGFEHTKACFVTEIILFLKVLKDTFNAFDKTLLDEITEVQAVFNQLEVVVDQCSCLELEAEFFEKKDFIEKEIYDKLVKIYSSLEKHCISLELATQLNQEIFQKENSGETHNAPTFNQLFEINELKAQSQAKDTVISTLKDRIKSLIGKESVNNVKKDIDEIETINIELEHSVAKLLSENEKLRKEREHLKSIYKDQFDSIKKTRVRSKEQSDSLIAQINTKSVENSDLNPQLQEKVFAITALKNEIRKLKGKNVVDTAVSKPNATTLAPGMEIVEQGSSLNLSNSSLDYACKVKCSTSASGLKPSGNIKNNRISQSSSSNKTNKVEDQSRSVKSRKNKKNRVDKSKCNTDVMQSMLNVNFVSEPISNALVKHSESNAKFKSLCAICNKCLFDVNHAVCLIECVNDVNVRNKAKSKRNKKRKVWKPTGKVFTKIRFSWKPTGRTFTIVGNRCHLTRITSTKIVPPKESTIAPVVTPTQGILVYSKRPKASRSIGSSSKAKIVESNTANTKEPNQSWGSTISDVPSFSLINCNLSKLFCVAFRKHTCFIRDLEGVDLLKGSRGSNLYMLSLETLMLYSPVCLLSKASKTKSWLWHQRLSHLNFNYINSLAKQGLVRGLPKLKYQKDHLCSACAHGKSKKHFHKPKAKDFIQEKLYLLHMDLYGPMRVQSISGRIYILVIVDDFSQFSWTLRAYYEEVGISHQTSVARTSQHNGFVERRNRTLVEAARTMLIFSKALNIEDADKTMDEINKQTQNMKQIQNALAASMCLAADFDEIICYTEKLVAREDVSYINAHATTTLSGDLMEYEAILRWHRDGKAVGIMLLEKNSLGVVRANSEDKLHKIHDWSLAWCLGVVEAVATVERDLTDSTFMRNIGVILSYSLLAYKSAIIGIGKL